MMVERHPVRNAVAYTLLVLGSVVFSFPFLWMVCSSVKVDHELFPERLEIFPHAPNAELKSPFIDTSYYRYAVSDLTRPYLELFEQIVRAVPYPYPDDVTLGTPLHDRAIREITRGVARKLDTILPPAVWEDAGALEAAARAAVDETLVGEVFNRVYRWLGVGVLKVHGYGDGEGLIRQEIGEGAPISKRLRLLTPTTTWLEDRSDRETPCAVFHTDFSQGGYWRLETTVETQFPIEDFYRIQLYLHPDDNWHRLYCFVEKEGKLFKSAQAYYPANFEWAVVTWQEPGPDDQSNKIKTWVHLVEADSGPQYVDGPNRMKVAFELHRSSPLQAWWGKVCRNYVLTLQHIPVWRYTATSFYLVILNILLSVFSCSVVAYAIARLNWPGRDFCFLLMLATMMIPPQVTMIPGFLIWKELGTYNTLVPLWLGAAFGSPFFIFLLRQFLKTIPRDLEDAARIDGCGYYRIYWYIMFPLVKPTIAVIAIGAFLGTWNSFMGPLIFIADQRLYPLAFGLYAFAVQVGNNPALTMAGSFLMTVPIIVIFFFAQRYFIEGVTLTGLKG